MVFLNNLNWQASNTNNNFLRSSIEQTPLKCCSSTPELAGWPFNTKTKLEVSQETTKRQRISQFGECRLKVNLELTFLSNSVARVLLQLIKDFTKWSVISPRLKTTTGNTMQRCEPAMPGSWKKDKTINPSREWKARTEQALPGTQRTYGCWKTGGSWHPNYLGNPANCSL